MDTAKRFLNSAELEHGLSEVLSSPCEEGTLSAIVVRPAENQRRRLESVAVSPQHGIEGDRWVHEASPDRDSQVSLMNSRYLEQIAGSDDAICLAGDNLVIDFDLSDQNLPSGSRLMIGDTVIVEINAVPHTGCGKFSKRFGADVRTFINDARGRQLHLRGCYGSIITGGTIAVGDTVRKLPALS